MYKPLIFAQFRRNYGKLCFARGVNLFPLVSHTRNSIMNIWEKTIEYEIPIMEKLVGKPKVVIENDILKIIFTKSDHAVFGQEGSRRV